MVRAGVESCEADGVLNGDALDTVGSGQRVWGIANNERTVLRCSSTECRDLVEPLLPLRFDLCFSFLLTNARLPLRRRFRLFAHLAGWCRVRFE